MPRGQTRARQARASATTRTPPGCGRAAGLRSAWLLPVRGGFQAAGGGDHRRGPLVNGLDDLGVVDPAPPHATLLMRVHLSSLIVDQPWRACFQPRAGLDRRSLAARCGARSEDLGAAALESPSRPWIVRNRVQRTPARLPRVRLVTHTPPARSQRLFRRSGRRRKAGPG